MNTPPDDEVRLQEFYELAVKSKQLLEDHNIETITDTMAGHMALFIQRERNALVEREKVKAPEVVTRFEVIDSTGRAYVGHGIKIELSYQDEGRTLKVFVNERTS